MTLNTPGQPPAGVTYCGRDFTPAEMDVITGLAGALPTRSAISRAVCDALGWHAPGGRRKDMTARVALARMAADGLITLPAPRNGNGNGRHPRHADTRQLALPLNPPPVTGALAGLQPITLVPVTSGAGSARWNQLIRAHHYLGYTPLAGAQLRYLVTSPAAGVIGALGYGAAAWACAPRDHWIGWDQTARKARLHLIAGNARFLILPNVHVPNLASHILARAARQLPADWQDRYGYAPVLLETFVDTNRFTGASYRAAGWTWAGYTKGRGKLDTGHQHTQPVKDIYLYPLQARCKHILTSPG
ncbi:MAG: DUF4338 domain-containing protein [Streptosporangiaceae bacterium]